MTINESVQNTHTCLLKAEGIDTELTIVIDGSGISEKETKPVHDMFNTLPLVLPGYEA